MRAGTPAGTSASHSPGRPGRRHPTSGTIPFHPDAVIRAGGHRYRIVDPDVAHRYQVWRCERCGDTSSPNAPYIECAP